MKGNNTIILCPATMIEALQEWCDKHIKDPVRVKTVKECKGVTNTFEVDVEAIEEGAKP